jgi:predicted transcriptional regulator
MERPPVKLENLEALQMRRSKLEMYVDILKVLAHTGPLKLTHIMNKANVNGGVLTEYLGYLIEKGLVEERTIRKGSTVFAISQRGINLLKVFREFTQVLTVP